MNFFSSSLRSVLSLSKLYVTLYNCQVDTYRHANAACGRGKFPISSLSRRIFNVLHGRKRLYRAYRGRDLPVLCTKLYQGVRCVNRNFIRGRLYLYSGKTALLLSTASTSKQGAEADEVGKHLSRLWCIRERCIRPGLRIELAVPGPLLVF